MGEYTIVYPKNYTTSNYQSIGWDSSCTLYPSYYSYPVYVKDSTKQAFEIIKVLQDKKLLKLDKVSDFIEVMDAIIEKLNH